MADSSLEKFQEATEQLDDVIMASPATIVEKDQRKEQVNRLGELLVSE